MKAVGIIAEYNPFHNGHLYQMQEARRLSGADYLVVLMSPDFVQRGEPALLDKWSRARMALMAGGDLVLELPVRYATGSAESFAGGAVSILSNLGVVDSLSFGCEMSYSESETSQTDILFEYASFLSKDEPEEYRSILKEHLKNGVTYAAARHLAYLSYTGTSDPDGLLKSPNNILAIEYKKAILRNGSDLSILPIRRIGAGYHDQNVLHSGRYASATGIREALIQGRDIHPLMPAESFEILKDELSLRRFLLPKDLDLVLHLALHEKKSSLTDYADVSEDLANRIEHLLPQYLGFDQFSGLLKTKQIAYTRVRRALLHILLGIRSGLRSGSPFPTSYARVLGFRKSAAPLLHEIKVKASIPLITKLPSDSRRNYPLPDSQDPLVFDTTTHSSNAKPLSYDTEALFEDLNAASVWELIASHKTGAPVRNEQQRQLVIL